MRVYSLIACALIAVVPVPATAAVVIAAPAKQMLAQADSSSTTCSIMGTSFAWNPPGTMDVSVDGSSVGSFSFGPGGSDELDFTCTPGRHSFRFSIEGTPIVCAGLLRIGTSTTFIPAMRVDPMGNSVCSLTPQ